MLLEAGGEVLGFCCEAIDQLVNISILSELGLGVDRVESVDIMQIETSCHKHILAVPIQSILDLEQLGLPLLLIIFVPDLGQFILGIAFTFEIVKFPLK